MRQAGAVFAGTIVVVVFLAAGCAPRRVTSTSEARASVSRQAIRDESKPQLAHQLLQPLVGRWRTISRYRPGPNETLRVMEGRAETGWVINDLFLQEEVVSAATPISKEYRGLGLTGYDAASNNYQSVWIDNQRSDILTGTGSVDASGKLFTFSGSYNDPVTGKQVSTRRVITVISDDSHTMDLFQRVAGGPEIKILEVIYTRDTAMANLR